MDGDDEWWYRRVGAVQDRGSVRVDFNKTRYYFVSFCFVVVYSFEELLSVVAGRGGICSARGRTDFLAPGEKKVDLSLCLVFEPPIAVPTEKARISTQVYFMHSILVRMLYTSQWDSEPKLQRRFTERWHVARN